MILFSQTFLISKKFKGSSQAISNTAYRYLNGCRQGSIFKHCSCKFYEMESYAESELLCILDFMPLTTFFASSLTAEVAPDTGSRIAVNRTSAISGIC
jgi:hypothetical protein